MNPFSTGGTPPAEDPRTRQCRQLTRDANYAGLLLIVSTALYLFFFDVVLLVLGLFGAADLSAGQDRYFGLSYGMYLLVYGIVYTVDIGLPGPLVTALSGRRVNPFSRMGERRLKRPLTAVLAVVAGMGACILAYFITAYLYEFLSQLGYRQPSQPGMLRASWGSLAVNILLTAALPAVLEEMLFRGYVLRALLPHGGGLAILASSLLFALLHAEPVQIVFTFMVGVICGWLTVKSGSIWPAVALHFLNNLTTVSLNYINLSVDEAAFLPIMLGVYLAIGVAGAAAAMVLHLMKDPVLRRDPPPLPGQAALPAAGQRVRALLCATAFMVSLALLAARTILVVIPW